jgi:hypothetical protein
MSTLIMAAMVKTFAGGKPAKLIALSPRFKTSAAGAAFKRCRATWHPLSQESVAMRRDRNQDPLFLTEDAAADASKAYPNAMPLLSGAEDIGDFTACVAHGVLIDAFTPQMNTQLLYAAQVAISALLYQPVTAKSNADSAPYPGSIRTQRLKSDPLASHMASTLTLNTLLANWK